MTFAGWVRTTGGVMADAGLTSLTFEDADDVAQFLKSIADAGRDDDDVFHQTTDALAPTSTHHCLLAVRSTLPAAICLV